jgi:hypothetical protein
VIQFDMEMRMGIFRFFALTLLLSMLLVPNIFGNGFAYEGIGVKATGMGGAFRAVADDWSAAYYNPAGYARINDNILSANLASFHNRYWIKPNVLWGDEYESGFYNGLDVPNNHAILNVPQVGAVARFPIWNEMVLGFSIIQLYDQNQKWRFIAIFLLIVRRAPRERSFIIILMSSLSNLPRPANFLMRNWLLG